MCVSSIHLRVKPKANQSKSLTPTPFNLRGRDWLKLPAKSRQKVVEQAFKYWRARGFPHYEIADIDLCREFANLEKSDWSKIFQGCFLRAANTGLRVANAFQPAIWSVEVSRYKTPLEVFRDDKLLRKAIARSLSIWPDRFGTNASCLRRILKSFPSTAGASNFRPSIARALIAQYSNPDDLVVDFSAGFGGRLLGCMAAPRAYIGIEPNLRQVVGMKRMMTAIRANKISVPNFEFRCGCAEDELRHMPARSAGMVFSSPPFFDWERYSRSKKQSFVRYQDYGAWRRHFLQPVIAESFRILRPAGGLILSVTNGRRLPSAGDVEDIAVKVGFRLANTHYMSFPKIPYLHPRNGVATKHETVLVFQKPEVARFLLPRRSQTPRV